MGDRLSPGYVLVLRYHLESLLTAPRSPTGIQLEQARQGWSEAPCGVAVSPIRYLEMVGYCRDLTPQEEAICRLRYGPMAKAMSEEYERNAPAEQIKAIRLDGGPPTLLTRDGEEHVRGLEEGRVLVRGIRARMLSYLEIGQQVGLSARQVERRISSALDKIRRAVKAAAEKQ